MAANLVKAGVRVLGHDVVPEAMESARINGVHVVTDPLEAVAQADVVLTMLPSGQHVISAYQDSPGSSAAKPGTIFLTAPRSIFRSARGCTTGPKGRIPGS